MVDMTFVWFAVIVVGTPVGAVVMLVRWLLMSMTGQGIRYEIKQ